MKKFGSRFRQFMAGRYGTDKLNTAILIAGVAISLLCLFFSIAWLRLTLTICSYLLMLWAIFRALSHNTYKRYQENRRFLAFIERIKDRDHRYFSCPRCHQPVRVPRGKGKISISCPKCKERFIKKT